MSNSALRWDGAEGCSGFDCDLACVFFAGGVCTAGEGCADPLLEAGANLGAFAGAVTGGVAALPAGAAFGAGAALGAFGAAVLEAGAFAAFGEALPVGVVAGFFVGAAAFAWTLAGPVGPAFSGVVFCSPADLGLAGVGWDLGMEVVLGGTCFADAAAALLALCGGASLATFAALGVTGLAEDWGADAVLEAEGIDREPLVRGLEMLTWLAEPVFWAQFFGFAWRQAAVFLEGIP